MSLNFKRLLNKLQEWYYRNRCKFSPKKIIYSLLKNYNTKHNIYTVSDDTRNKIKQTMCCSYKSWQQSVTKRKQIGTEKDNMDPLYIDMWRRRNMNTKQNSLLHFHALRIISCDRPFKSNILNISSNLIYNSW